MYQNIADGDDGVFAMGWWVYTPRSISVPLDFTIPDGLRNNYIESYHPDRGWNLIGITRVMLGRSLNDVKGSCNYVSVYSFERGEWHKASNADLAENLTQDSLGHALAMKVTDDCTMSFAALAPQIPTLPE
jgi:hypothetical protein